MKSVDFRDRLYSIETRNRFGRPNGLGFMTCGVTFLADENDMAGIYQKRRASGYKFDNLTGVLGAMILGQNQLATPYLKKINDNYFSTSICRMRHYFPINRRTEAQQTWRSYFALVLSTWQSLTQEEKNIWNAKSYPAHMTGWNRYASYHLKARDL